MLAAILCVIALVAAPVVANEAWQVTTWTTGEALPQGVVDAVHQTRDGYIWFTTLGGLVRYDGVAFTVFEKATTPGLRSNRFVNLLETPDGTLWAGTEDGFVTSDRNGRFSTRSVDGTINPVLGIAAAGSQPWVVTPRGRFRFDGQRFVPAGEAPTTLRFLYMTGSAVVTHDGVVVLRPAEPPKVLPFPGLVGEVAATVRADAGGWWIADRRGVFRYSAGELQQVDAPRLLEIVRQATRAAEGREALGAITRTRDGAFWISQSGRGVARVDGDSVEWITPQDGLASTDASRIYEDHDGTIWVTTLGGGVSAIHRRPARTYAAAAGLSPPDAYPILPWKGGLLVGSWGGGVYQFDGKQFTHATPSSGFVMSMADGGDGTLWVSTRGVWRIHGREVRHFDVSDGLPSDIVPVIYRARDGRMWFGTIAGLASLGANDRFTTHRMPSPATNAIRTIAEERDGSLLLGTRGGLLRFRDGHATLLADERSGLSSELVRAIRVEPDGTIWFGTYDGGLNRLRNGKLSVITTRQGLFDNGVFSIVKDRGFFWMSSNRGVHRASIRELNAVADGRMAKISPLAVTHADGLLSPECNGGVQPVAARTPDGRLWFPTQNGIAAIDPRLVPADLPPPPILMSGISVDGEPVQPAGEVRISSKSRRVEFRFAAPSTRPSVVTRYRYQLEGFDRGWNEIVGER
ncbi:MAG TPA: two-component regulator propeller domain-containing protein, partial [Thermoanaerobaculia bacterium]|nr:two-component regulator propeller domain-containing protein [Thermoanaerobaculia bacterium]